MLRKLLPLFLLLLFVPIASHAQATQGTVVVGRAVPTGTCKGTNALFVNIATSLVYPCHNGTWGTALSSGAVGSVAGTINQIDSTGGASPVLSFDPVAIFPGSVAAPIYNLGVASMAPAPVSNAGTAALTNGTDNGGIIATGVASTTTTLTFGVGWSTWASCTVSASNGTALPYVSAISKSAVTFTYVTTGTPSLYYGCSGH